MSTGFWDTYSIKQEGASCVQSILRLIVALQQRKSIVIVLQLKSEIVAGQSCKSIAFTLSLMSLLSTGLVIKQSLPKSLITSESVSLK